MVKSICVIGAGHVGVPHAATIAKKCPSIRVTVVDEDARKIAACGSPRPLDLPLSARQTDPVRDADPLLRVLNTAAFLRAEPAGVRGGRAWRQLVL